MSRLGNVFVNDRLGAFSIETLIELGGVKVQIGGVLFEVDFGECADILAAPFGKQFVVIFPELALLVRALRCIRRPMRFVDAIRDKIYDGIVLVRELDLTGLDIVGINLASRASRKLLTARSLKVRIVKQFYFRVRVAFRPARGSRTTAAAHRRRRDRCLQCEEHDDGNQNENTDPAGDCPSR